ncbi:MAG: hemolysin family protein [Leptospirales bacterium]
MKHWPTIPEADLLKGHSSSMVPVWLDIIAIFLLILVNAFLAAAELSIISIRLSRVHQMATNGAPETLAIEKLRKDPERFVATVQVLMTLITSMTSALTGTVTYEFMKPRLTALPIVQEFHVLLPLAVAIVILLQVYSMLVLGEIAPKTLAIRNNERIAMLLSRPTLFLAEILSVPVRIITATSQGFLRMMGINPGRTAYPISPEELDLLLKEGTEHGVINRTEQDLIQSVFKFTDISVREVMIPRMKVVAMDSSLTIEQAIQFLSDHRFSRYPVIRTGTGDVVGILYYKDLFEKFAQGKQARLTDLVHAPYFIPESMKVAHTLKEMQKRRTQMALVLSEYGTMEGLVTMEDLLEELVGEIEDESDDIQKPVERLRDGSFLIDASQSIRDLREDYNIDIPEGDDYETLAGYVIAQLQTIPRGGEFFYANNMKISIVDMEKHRVSRVKIEPVPEMPELISHPARIILPDDTQTGRK